MDKEEFYHVPIDMDEEGFEPPSFHDIWQDLCQGTCFIRSLVLIPIGFCICLIIKPCTFYISDLNLSLSKYWYPYLVLTLTMLWLHSSALQKVFGKSKVAMATYYLFLPLIFSLPCFAQYHFYLSCFLLLCVTGEIVLELCLFLKRKWSGQEWDWHICCTAVVRRFVTVTSAILLVPGIISVACYELESPNYTALEALWEELFTPTTSTETNARVDTTELLEANQSLIDSILIPELWMTYSEEDRIDRVQALAALEWVQLGLDGMPVPTVYVHKLDGDDGFFQPFSWTIHLDLPFLAADDPEPLINLLSHEVYHAYTHSLVTGLDWEHDPLTRSIYFDEAYCLWENYNNYIEAYENYQGYLDQPIEESARDFAAEEYALLLATSTREQFS